MSISLNKIKVETQYILPKKIITKTAGLLANAKLGKTTTYMIEQFSKFYDINTDEMEGEITDFQTFSEFFARPLKKAARPIDKKANSLVYPVDGTISELGDLNNGLLLQAKNHYYTAEALLAGNEDAQTFANGKFITIYLSPKDYHRVHIPFGGKLIKMTYVPGELFSVNQLNAQNIPELFSRNERVVCIFETEIGKMAVIMVGATIVRSIITPWAGVVAPNDSYEVKSYDYASENIEFDKGDEIGKFTMGSTVICLFEKDKIKFLENLEPQLKTRMGEKMGEKISHK